MTRGKTYEEIYGVEKAKELRELRRQAKLGVHLTEYQKQRFTFKGRSHTEKTKEEMSKNRTGNKNSFYKNVHSEKSKQKNREAHLGKKHSKVTKQRISEAIKGTKIGCDNPAWLGGKSFEPYSAEWTPELREQIRKRDNYTCQILECGLVQNGRPHDVHHVDYNKKNSTPLNLLTLCVSCHARVGVNREYWTSFFQILQTEKVVFRLESI